MGGELFSVDINTERDRISPVSPATRWFDHVVLAIRLPNDLNHLSLHMIITHPKLGRLLILDPTDGFTTSGHRLGDLHQSYAFLPPPDGVRIRSPPQLRPPMTGARH